MPLKVCTSETETIQALLQGGGSHGNPISWHQHAEWNSVEHAHLTK